MHIVCEQCGMPHHSTVATDMNHRSKGQRCSCCGWPTQSTTIDDIDAGWLGEEEIGSEDLCAILLEPGSSIPGEPEVLGETEPEVLGETEPEVLGETEPEVLALAEVDPLPEVGTFPTARSRTDGDHRVGLPTPTARSGSSDGIVAPSPISTPSAPSRFRRSTTRVTLCVGLAASIGLLVFSQMREGTPKETEMATASPEAQPLEPAFELLTDDDPPVAARIGGQDSPKNMNRDDSGDAPARRNLAAQAPVATADAVLPGPGPAAAVTAPGNEPAPPQAGPFDAANAMQGMTDAVRTAQQCLAASSRFGTLGFAVTFEPSGQVASAAVSGPSLRVSQGAGSCFRRAVGAIRVPRFVGENVVLKLSLPIGPAR